MRDKDIRKSLLSQFENQYGDCPETVVVEELGLYYGEARVDLATINGTLHGWEIKSDRDNLQRLPKQAKIYNTILDRVTLVCTARHLEKARKIIPDWWGVSIARSCDTGLIRVESIKAAEQNESVDPLALASLLWRNETLELLEQLGAIRGTKTKPRYHLYCRLAEEVSKDELGSLVRMTLRRRFTQSVSVPSMTNDARFQPSSM